MSKIRKVIYLLIFILAFSSFFIAARFIDDAALLDEKKTLAEFPEEFSNDYFAKVSAWFEDRSPLRNTLIAFKTKSNSALLLKYATGLAPKIDTWLGYEIAGDSDYEKQMEIIKRLYGDIDSPDNPDDPEETHTHSLEVVYSREVSVLHDGVTISECTECGKRFVSNIVPRTSLSDFANTRINYSTINGGVIGKFDWLFSSIDNSITYYEGSNILSESEMAEFTSMFQTLSDLCKAKGIKLVLLVGPNKEQIYSEYMPDNLWVQTEDKRIDVLSSYVKANSDALFIYPKEELLGAKLLYDTYYMQDTHWNSVGAYVATMSIYEALGFESSELLYQNIMVSSRTGGDISNLTGNSCTYDNYLVDYKPDVNVYTQNYYNKVTNSVSSGKCVHYAENAVNDCKLLMIGDSFRENMEPILKKDFAKTTVVHNSDIYTVDPELGYSVAISNLYELGEGDVLILEAVERRDTDLIKVVEAVIELMQ